MGEHPQEPESSRKERLRRLDRSLLRIGLFLILGALAIEVLLQPQFSLQRFLFLAAAAVLGLLLGRALSRIFFIIRG